MIVMIYFIAFISILLGSFAQFLLKTGMNSMNLQQPPPLLFKTVITNIPLISGILCYITSLFFWLFVLSKLDLSKAYPMVSLGYIFTLILGYYFFNESINLFKILGVSLIILGVFLITKN